MFSRSSSILFAILISLSIGCGGGGSSSTPTPPPPTNNAPTVTASGGSVEEGQSITLSAVATDSDGTISSYSWTQVSGPTASLSNANTADVTLLAPPVTADTDIELRITVTDNNGATGSTNVIVNVLSKSIQLSISGKILSGNAASANLVATVDGQSFTATADNQGAYSIDIIIDDSAGDKVVQITSTEANASIVKLSSIVGGLNTLIGYSGNDLILTSDEVFAVDLSYVTTAITALMEDQNNGGSIINDIQYHQSLVGYSSANLTEMVIAQILVSNYSTDDPVLVMPAQFTDMLEFIRDDVAIQNYILKARGVFASYQNAKNDFISDTSLTRSVINQTITPVQENYYFFTGNRISLAAGNIGSSFDLNGEVALTWSYSAGNLNTNFAGLGLLVGVNFNRDPNTGATIREETRISEKNIKWLSQTPYKDLLSIESFYYKHYPNGELPDTTPIAGTNQQSVTKTPAVINVADVIALGEQISLPHPVITDAIVNPTAEGVLFGTPVVDRRNTQMVFSGDFTNGGTVNLEIPQMNGDGTEVTLTDSLSWNINAQGQLILQGQDTYNYVFMGTQNGSLLANVVLSNALPSIPSAEEAYVGPKQNWTANIVAGIYVSSEPQFSDTYFWVELFIDGTALTVSGFDENLDGQLGNGEFQNMPGFWNIRADGKLVIRRYRNNSLLGGGVGYCTALEFDPPGDAQCILYHERIWDLYAITASNRHKMQHQHQFYEDPFMFLRSDQSVQGHILAFASFSNRDWQKTDVRPIEIVATPLSMATSQPQMLNQETGLKVEDIQQVIQQDLKRENRR